MNIKRIISLLLALVMVLGFAACELDQETVELAVDVAEVLLTESEETAGEPSPEEAPEAPVDESPAPPAEEEAAAPAEEEEAEAPAIDEFGVYTTKEDVALYLHTYGRLPDNFMTKNEARDLGWEGGGLDPYADGMCIGGDRFGNYEGLLPEQDGRTYRECDIDTLHASSRGAKRIVFSNDGLIYYTEDHYESFTLLYGDENQ